MAGIFLFYRLRHLYLDFASPLPFPPDLPRISDYSGVIDLNILQSSLVQVHIEAANNPCDGQVKFCVCHAKLGNVSKTVPLYPFIILIFLYLKQC